MSNLHLPPGASFTPEVKPLPPLDVSNTPIPPTSLPPDTPSPTPTATPTIMLTDTPNTPSPTMVDTPVTTATATPSPTVAVTLTAAPTPMSTPGGASADRKLYLPIIEK